MRDRIEIEDDARKARPGPDSPVTTADLTLEVLLDIRDLLNGIDTRLEEAHDDEEA